jgi:hypothetical protein
MQKAFAEEGVCAAVRTVPDLFAPSLRTVLKIRMAAIATRISPGMLNEGISHSPIEIVRGLLRVSIHQVLTGTS